MLACWVNERTANTGETHVANCLGLRVQSLRTERPSGARHHSMHGRLHRRHALAEMRDYIDMAALISHGISLPAALASARAIYGGQFNPQITLKALSYYGDGDLAMLPLALQHQLQDAARAVDLEALPRLEP